MTKSEREERVLGILENILARDRGELTPLALLVEDLGMDSLDRVEITMALEEELEEEFVMKHIDEHEADLWRTVSDVQNTAKKMARNLVIPLLGTVS